MQFDPIAIKLQNSFISSIQTTLCVFIVLIEQISHLLFSQTSVLKFYKGSH
jgi:hypothetical protein